MARDRIAPHTVSWTSRALIVQTRARLGQRLTPFPRPRNGCTAFPHLWAQAIRVEAGREVTFTDLTGAMEVSPPEGKTSASLLGSLRINDRAQAQEVSDALMKTGLAELG